MLISILHETAAPCTLLLLAGVPGRPSLPVQVNSKPCTCMLSPANHRAAAVAVPVGMQLHSQPLPTLLHPWLSNYLLT